MNWYDPGTAVEAWTRTWLRAWTEFAGDVAAAQQRAAAAFWPAAVASGGVQDDRDVEGQPDRSAATLPSMTYGHEDWRAERSVDAAADIGVGDSVRFEKRITDSDVRAFARASGDTNRLHLDEAFARRTRFGERVVHGTLVVGLVSAALARLPGLTIYVSQDVRYLAPVRIGDSVAADCEVVEDLGDGKFRLVTVVTDGDDRTVVDGEAVVLVDDLPEPAVEE